MGWQLTESIEDYAAAVGAWLRSRPAANTVSLTVIESARAAPATDDPIGSERPLYAWWTTAEDVVAGAASITPPYGLLLPELPAAALPGLVGLLQTYRPAIGTVNAPTGTARAFADGWAATTGAAWHAQFELTLHQLNRLLPPAAPPAGAASTARPADTEAAQGLWLECDHEVGFDHRAASLAAAAQGVSAGRVMLWDLSGRPVGLAARTLPAAGVVRVGPVYTLPAHRGRGIGAALTAAVTRSALQEGTEVVLFTDRGNPTANALYHRLGYQPVGDRIELAFASA
jgi:GNAT superfamily N-acetyltransferase